ncbi:hypothetical protein [Sphingomonas koreensis]
MHPDYSDILDRIAEAPFWWFNGVPRYKSFSPDDLSVGPQEAGLALVRCQECGTEFVIGVEPSQFVDGSMLDQIVADDFNYDDPPRHSAPDGSRCAGETMGAVPIMLIEAWRLGRDSFEWVRQPQFEGPLESTG